MSCENSRIHASTFEIPSQNIILNRKPEVFDVIFKPHDKNGEFESISKKGLSYLWRVYVRIFHIPPLIYFWEVASSKKRPSGQRQGKLRQNKLTLTDNFVIRRTNVANFLGSVNSLSYFLTKRQNWFARRQSMAEYLISYRQEIEMTILTSYIFLPLQLLST